MASEKPVVALAVNESALVPSPERNLVPVNVGQRVTIVVPAFNEESGIAPVLEKLKTELGGAIGELIVVDDGSTDDTAKIVEASDVRVIRHPVNRGYGASLRSGLRAAETEYVLTMDADGQHRISDVVALIRAAAEHPDADLIVGHRAHLIHSPLWRMPGKWFLTRFAEFLVQRKIPDLNSGLRLVRREIALKYVSICPAGFSFSTTITMAFLSRGYSVLFVPIRVEPRTGKSTVKLKTGFDTIMLVLRLAALFNPLRIFLPLSGVAWLAGIGWSIPYLSRGEGVTVLAMLLMVTGVLLFALGMICDQLSQLRLERYE
jgi:glycosyltransferase involved in cell wall biosynthesis